MSGLLGAHLNAIDSASSFQPLVSFRPNGAILSMSLHVELSLEPKHVVPYILVWATCCGVMVNIQGGLWFPVSHSETNNVDNQLFVFTHSYSSCACVCVCVCVCVCT